MKDILAIIGAVHLCVSAVGFGLGVSGLLDDRTCVTPIAEMGRSYRQGLMAVRE